MEKYKMAELLTQHMVHVPRAGQANSLFIGYMTYLLRISSINKVEIFRECDS